MPSFLDDMNQMIVDETITEIALELFEDWDIANRDEGDLYADFQIASRTTDKYIAEVFNSYYHLVPGDQYFVP